MLVFEPTFDEDGGPLSTLLSVIELFLKGWRGWIFTLIFLGAGVSWLVDFARPSFFARDGD
jgi:hypothetical protein